MWLVQHLRQYAPHIVGCPDENTHPVFFLGPVAWINSSKDAYVYYGGVSSLVGRAGYKVHRGFLGRWKFSVLVQE